MRDFRPELPRQLDGGRRAAIGDAFQRREVVFAEGRMFDQLPGDGRNPTGGVDALALDELHGELRVPLVHQHRFAAGHH